MHLAWLGFVLGAMRFVLHFFDCPGGNPTVFLFLGAVFLCVFKKHCVLLD